MSEPVEAERASRIALGVALLWLAAALYVSLANPILGMSDMFGFIRRAERLSLHELSVWVDGFYPFGYPALLRALSALSGDYAISGRLLSLASGALVLASVYGIAAAGFGARSAVATLVLTCVHPGVLRWSSLEGTDMPATAVLLAAVLLLCRSSAPGTARPLRLRLAAGGALGASYLLRYTALSVLPACLLWAWFATGRQARPAARARSAGALLAGFLAIALPQLVLSTVVVGNPFYNTQVRNVYFGMFGEQNWGLHMRDAASAPGLLSLVLADPGAFAAHWIANGLAALKMLCAGFPPLLLALAGFAFAIRDVRARAAAALLALVGVSFAAAISLAFPDPRLLLPSALAPLPLAGLAVARFLEGRLPLAGRIGARTRSVLCAAALALVALRTVFPLLAQPQSPYAASIARVSSLLDEQGLEDPAQVLSFSFDYYHVASPTKQRFALPWYGASFEPYASVQDVAQRMRTAGQRYLVFDESAPQNVPGLAEIWPLEPSQLDVEFQTVAVLPGSVRILVIRERRPASSARSARATPRRARTHWRARAQSRTRRSPA